MAGNALALSLDMQIIRPFRLILDKKYLTVETFQSAMFLFRAAS